MHRLNVLAACKVRNRACHLQDAVVGACRQVQALHRHAQEIDAGFVGLGILVYHAFCHLCVAVYSFDVLEALLLYVARLDDALTDDFARFAGLCLGYVAERHGRYFALYVDAVEQRSGNLAQIVLTLICGAHARLAGVAVIATWAGIHTRHQHKRCGIVGGVFRAADGDLAVFKRLTHHLKHCAVKFGKFVEKKHPIVRQTDFARRGVSAAAYQCHRTDGVVWRAIWTRCE